MNLLYLDAIKLSGKTICIYKKSFKKMSRIDFSKLFVMPDCGKGTSWARFIASFLIAFLVLSTVSFLMLWLGDKIKGSGMAYTRYMARGQAPLTGQFYPSNSQNQITVLTYDRQFLKDSGSAWPISYGQHADWIQKIVEEESTRPKAIFIDVTFTEARDDASVSVLLTTLCKAKKEYNVDVYLAALASSRDGQLHVREGLEQGVDEGCFELVSVNYKPDTIDRIAWEYPIYSHVGETGWASGLPKENQSQLTSAAAAIATGSAGIELPIENDPMSIVWGVTNNQPTDNRPHLLDYCRDGQVSYLRLVPGILRDLFVKSDPRPICPYNRTYSMSQLTDLPEAQLMASLKDKYVLIGAVIPGHNDLVDSPVHGLIPGIYLHAMALDNLLTYGEDFKRSESWEFPPSNKLLIAGLTAVFLVLVVRVLWRCLAVKLKIGLSPVGRKPMEEIEIHQRFVRLIPASLNWMLRMAVQASISMGTIVILQRFFTIGMLPVVELIGMTILAEGLDYMGKIQKFLAPVNQKNIHKTEIDSYTEE